MNLEATIQNAIPEEMNTATIISLWALIAIIIYFVVNKTLRGFYKRTEKKTYENYSFVAQKEA